MALFPLGCGESSPPPLYVRPSDRPLVRPDAPEMMTTAPERFRVRFTTSQGDFTITVVRAWAPLGADRFHNLVRGHFFEDARFFRVKIAAADARGRENVARYLYHSPVALGRIMAQDATSRVVYKSDSVHPRHGANFRVLDPLEFIRLRPSGFGGHVAEVVAHIPDAYEKTAIKYGWYSNRTRGWRKKRGISRPTAGQGPRRGLRQRLGGSAPRPGPPHPEGLQGQPAPLPSLRPRNEGRRRH